MHFVPTLLTYAFLIFLSYETFSSISNGLIQENLFYETSIEYTGWPGVLETHRRLGLGGKKKVHIDLIYMNSSFLGYSAESFTQENFNYEVQTFSNRTNSYWFAFRIKKNSEGFVIKIESRASGDLDLGTTKTIIKIRNFLCFLCNKKIKIPHSIPKSKYANAGPMDIDFPLGREKSIRFKLGYTNSPGRSLGKPSSGRDIACGRDDLSLLLRVFANLPL